MATDQDLINSAYENTIKTIFTAFHTNRIASRTAKDPKAADQEAEHAFTDGIASAKKTRDRAIELLKVSSTV